MKIILEQQEAENLFYDAMCNALGYMTSGYDLELDFDEDEYRSAHKQLNVKNPDESVCFEDILMEILRSGGKLTLVDNNDDENHDITLKDVHERVANTPHRHLMDAINENGDACTADCILQTVWYNEVVYG
jgi:hypothetical protein